MALQRVTNMIFLIESCCSKLSITMKAIVQLHCPKMGHLCASMLRAIVSLVAYRNGMKNNYFILHHFFFIEGTMNIQNKLQIWMIYNSYRIFLKYVGRFVVDDCSAIEVNWKHRIYIFSLNFICMELSLRWKPINILPDWCYLTKLFWVENIHL